MAEERRSYYQLLGVRENADLEQLRDAFYALAKSLHPDARAGASEGETHLADRRMREINEAWHVLRDPDQRTAYDEQLAHDRERAQLIAKAKNTPVDPRVLQHEVELLGQPNGAAIAAADDVMLSRPVAFLLRRGPIIALVLVVAALFIGTAYAGGDREPSDQPTPMVTDSTPGLDDSLGGN